MFVSDGTATALDDDDVVIVESTKLDLVGKVKELVGKDAGCPVCASRIDCERADVVMGGVAVAAVADPLQPSSFSMLFPDIFTAATDACPCVCDSLFRGNSVVSRGGLGLGSGGPCCCGCLEADPCRL